MTDFTSSRSGLVVAVLVPPFGLCLRFVRIERPVGELLCRELAIGNRTTGAAGSSLIVRVAGENLRPAGPVWRSSRSIHPLAELVGSLVGHATCDEESFGDQGRFILPNLRPADEVLRVDPRASSDRSLTLATASASVNWVAMSRVLRGPQRHPHRGRNGWKMEDGVAAAPVMGEIRHAAVSPQLDCPVIQARPSAPSRLARGDGPEKAVPPLAAERRKKHVVLVATEPVPAGKPHGQSSRLDQRLPSLPVFGHGVPSGNTSPRKWIPTSRARTPLSRKNESAARRFAC